MLAWMSRVVAEVAPRQRTCPLCVSPREPRAIEVGLCRLNSPDLSLDSLPVSGDQIADSVALVDRDENCGLPGPAQRCGESKQVRALPITSDELELYYDV